MLNLIGVGLNDFRDLSLKSKELIRESDYVYLEYYTSKLSYNDDNELINDFKKLFGKELVLLYRQDIEENEKDLLDKAKQKNLSLLVIGDAISATTHDSILLECKKQDIECNIIYNASIFSAIGVTGLQLYKFGKTASLVFEDRLKSKNSSDLVIPETPYKILSENNSINAHTLILLDMMIEKKLDHISKRFMTPNDAIKILLKSDDLYKKNNKNISLFNRDTYLIVCSRLGSKEEKIVYGSVKDLIDYDFKEPLHCLIVPSKLHFLEEEMLNSYKIKINNLN